MFGMADWPFAGDHGDCEQISVAVMPSVVGLSTREHSLFEIDEPRALRRDILRYDRYRPPGPERNQHRQIALSLCRLFNHKKRRHDHILESQVLESQVGSCPHREGCDRCNEIGNFGWLEALWNVSR